MTSAESSLVVEVEARSGGVCTLTRQLDPKRAESAVYHLELSPHATAGRSRRTWIAAIVGGPPIALVMYGVQSAIAAYDIATFDLSSSAGYMLTAAPCWQIPLGILAAAGLAHFFLVRRPSEMPSFVATLHESVWINGEDVGRFVRVESDVVNPAIVLLTEVGERRVEVGTANDAVVLADAIGRAMEPNTGQRWGNVS